MKITALTLKDFRNYDQLDIALDDGITLVMGKNAQGKTNLVESLVVLSTTKSPRTHNFLELVKDGRGQAAFSARVERKFGQVDLSCVVDNKGEKHFAINGTEVKKVSEVFSNLVVIYFSPQDLRMVSDSPQERRDFMDTDISQLSGSYYNLLLRYNKVLAQRNRLLKFEKDREELLRQLAVWNEQLASVAAPIIKTRKSFIERLKTPARDAMTFISQEKDNLEIEYVGARGIETAEIKAELLKSLEYNVERDIELGYTSIGPHRDDIYFGLNGKDARSFSSQGQQRSIVLALRLAEMEIFTEQLGETPVLILDDVFSELDTARQRKLYNAMRKYQTIITGTAFKFKPDGSYTKIGIEKGAVKSIKNMNA